MLIGITIAIAPAQTIQNYPVTTSAAFLAPGSQRLAEYFSSDKRLLIDLLLKDLTKSSLQVYLRFSLETTGLRLRTREGFVPSQFITLQRGIPTRLRGTDLQAAYFNPAALETEGFEVHSLYGVQLPEGFYTFKVEALEAATGQVVSNQTETYLVLAAPQPPILNVPLNGSEWPVTSQQKVPINWVPRHFSTPTTQAVYELKVCEVPEGFEPNEQVMLTCTEPRLEVTIPATSYAPDLTQWIKPLEVGHRYAVQVTVTDLSGELTNFVNGGRSQVSWFRYGKECVAPTFTIQSLGSDRVQLSWERTKGAQQYVVEYKLATGADWQRVVSSGSTQVISGLSVMGDYQFRMRSDCGGTPAGGSSGSPASEIQPWNIQEQAPHPVPSLPRELLNPAGIMVQVDTNGQAQTPTSLSALYANFPFPAGTTPAGANAALARLKLPFCAASASSFAGCEQPHPTVSLPSGAKELTSLSVGDVLGIYDYAVFVTKVNTTSSPLSGEGLVRLPFLNGAMGLVEFSGVSAKAGEEGANGGCVYDIDPSGYFRTKSASNDQLQIIEQGLISRLLNPSDSAATGRKGVFVGTLNQVLIHYDSLVSNLPGAGSAGLTADSRAELGQYLGAIQQGTTTLLTSLSNTADEGQDSRIKAIQDTLNALLAQEQPLLSRLTGSGDTTTLTAAELPLLTSRYQALFAQLQQLTMPASQTTTDAPTITPIVLSGLTATSATLRWQGDISLTKYVVHYQLVGAGELLQTVTTPTLQLPTLKAGSNYAYTVEAYQGSKVVSSYQGTFTTPVSTLATPQNLATTVIDEHTVQVNWDKDKDYAGYQLVYTDLGGVQRTLYPTTNQATLTGLDPAQTYSFQLIAFNKTNLASDPAGGRVASGPSCNLNVDDRNATNWSAITDGQHLLLASGCEGGQLSWSNGTAGTTQGNTIAWADGETGQLGGTLLGSHALTVNPQRKTTYTAICQMGSGSSQKACTYSVAVVVSSPECTGEFQIQASATSVRKGEGVTLTASGCAGQVIWLNGFGSAASFRLIPVSDMTVSAICTNGSTTCYAKPISIQVQTATASCITSLYVGPSEIHETNGILGIGKRTIHDSKVFYTGCKGGTVGWSTTGDIRGGLTQADTYAQLKDIQGPFTVSAVCQPANKELSSCAPVTLSYNDNCLSNAYTLALDNNGISAAIRLPSKPGYLALYLITAAQTNQMMLQDETGYAYNPTPARAVYVPISDKDKIYTAVMPPLGCTATLKVAGRISSPPSIQWSEQINKGSATKVGGTFSSVTNSFDLLSYTGYNASYRLLMRVDNCAGTLIWTNDQDHTFQRAVNQLDFSAINSPTVAGNTAYLTFPPVTTTYYATCTITNPDGSQAVFQAPNPKTLLITSDNCMRIEVATPSVAKGKPVQLTAVGCTGEVSWSAGGQLVGVGPSLTHTPVPATTPSAYVYTATCNNPVCDQSVTVQVNPCQFRVVSSLPSPVPIAQPVTLTSSGCEGGLVQWNTGETGASITDKPLEKTTYTATCLVDGASTCQAAQAVAVINTPPDDVACPPFELTSTTKTVVRCSQQPVVITPQGCPAGSIITWSDGHTSGPDEALKLNMNQGATITATCTTPYQIAVTQTLTIGVTGPELQVSPTQVYAGYPVILRASGCFTTDCQEGTYTWVNQTTGSVRKGASIQETLSSSTTYLVKCSSGGQKIVNVTLKQDCPVDYKSPAGVSGKSVLSLPSGCNADYGISWYQDNYDKGTSTLIAKDVKKVTVNLPACDQYGTGFGFYHVICVKDGKIPCETRFTVPCDRQPGSGPVSGDDPSSPDACNDLAFVEKGALKNIALNPGDDQSAGNYYLLYSDWCPGQVVWSDKAGAVQSSLTVGPFTSAPTYHYQCTLSSGQLCEDDYTLPAPSTNGGRQAAPVLGVSTAVSDNCSASLDLSVGLSVFYQKMLCQLSLLGQSREAIQAQLLSLEQRMAGLLQTSASATTIQFPTDLTPVVDALLAGQCEQAAKLLAAPNQTTQIYYTDYNALINDQYGTIEQGVIDATIQSIEFQKTVAGNVLDDNDKNACEYYPTYKTNNPIKEKAKWYYIGEKQTDLVNAKVRPKDRAKDVELSASGNVEITNVVNQQSPITFTLKSNTAGLGQVLGKERGKTETIDGLNVIVCKNIPIRITIYVVKNKKGGSFSVNQPAIESYIKSFFKTINFDVTVRFVIKTVDYAEFDKNSNGQIDKLDDGSDKDEANKMVSYAIDDNPDGFKVIMISLPVKKPGMDENQYVGGYADATTFRAVDKDTKANLKTSDYKAITQSIVIGTANGKIPFLPGTITHELGHFVLALKHPFSQFSPNFKQADDALNIMDYEYKSDGSTVIISNAERLFRAYQVKSIQDNLK